MAVPRPCAEGPCCSRPSAALGVQQTLDEMDFERGIWSAALNGDLGRVKYLIQKAADPSQPDSAGYTALHYASRNGHYAVCQFLLESGAKCDAQTHGGATALHRASYCGHTDIARLLLSHGSNPRLVDDDGMTSLHKAIDNISSYLDASHHPFPSDLCLSFLLDCSFYITPSESLPISSGEDSSRIWMPGSILCLTSDSSPP
ncbi:ankyrin repeat domain-containing protein 39 isoform X1 [Balaenoptera acutorostrata]|uniref:Ankyrin repeat domain-containing protein 39 isoform X1 n=1 Tax=Balaenoptera acutorostrata TaxID=9767 RepID=A0ABM3UHA6_BALAC|nr:ankyrin repeat domain-containing protein 39 isoform X1 [Balaenoptera acutorostrata]